MTQHWQLSHFDSFTLGMIIKGAWIYKQAPDFEKMKSSLSSIADMYPQLRGKFTEKGKAIVWDDQDRSDLQFTTVDLKKYSTADLAGNAKLTWSLVKMFDIKGFKEGSIEVFNATLAYLKDGAVLYVQCAHAAMDGQSFYSLIGQWASLYKGEAVEPLTVNQDLLPKKDALSKEETIKKAQENGWIIIGFKKLIKMLWSLVRNNRITDTTIIEVPQEKIAKLKEMSGTGTNAVLSAITLRQFSEHLPKRQKFTFLYVADLRGHYPGIDSTFFGNISQPVVAGSVDVIDNDAVIAQTLDKNLKDVLSSGKAAENVVLSQCASHYGLPYFYFDASDMNCSNPGSIYINNQLKFRACELDWGHGMPLYAFPNDLTDMVKFWQAEPGGPVQIIFGGLAGKLMRK